MAERTSPRRRRGTSRSTPTPSARASTARSSTSRCARSWPRAGRAPRRTKTRGEVRGGGAKPWRQKGTGRARAGSSRSPIWTGGGAVFGPSPRRYTFKVNRKERRAALRSALSVHAERGTIAVLDPAPFDTPSTEAGRASCIGDWSGGGSVLVVLAEEQARVALSFRNLARVVGAAGYRRRRRRPRRRGAPCSSRARRSTS